MKRDLGDCPSYHKRHRYKRDWCIKHGFKDTCSYCFLCEWIFQNDKECDVCPIVWRKTYLTCIDGNMYKKLPISEILALPEREVEDNG